MVYFDARLFVVTGQFAAVAFVTGAVAVLQHLEVAFPNGIQRYLRRFNIRLANVQGGTLSCLCVWPLRHREPVCEWGGWHLLATFTDR